VTTRYLSGLGDANADISQLQTALKELARVTGRAGIDPGEATGIMNDATMRGIASAGSLITDELPSWLYVSLQAALFAGSSSSFAQKQVTSFAHPIAAAVELATARYVSKHPQQGGSGMPDTMIAEDPWYKTPIGIGGIALGAFLAWKLLLNR